MIEFIIWIVNHLVYKYIYYYKVTAKNLDSLAGGYVKRGDYY